GYPHGPRHSPFRGSITRPASSLHPASHPPLLMMHAGSFLSCWLGFAQVGLGANLTHGVTLTSFLLAPSPRHGLAWRDTNGSWWMVQIRPSKQGGTERIQKRFEFHGPSTCTGW